MYEYMFHAKFLGVKLHICITNCSLIITIMWEDKFKLIPFYKEITIQKLRFFKPNTIFKDAI